MIRKILAGEYLKEYGDMSAQEREAYCERAGEWLRSAGSRLLTMTDRPMARSQSLMTMSVRWSREDCDAVHEGTVLLTALMAVTDTWLPSQLWTKSAWRAVRKLVGELSSIHHYGAGAAKEEPAVETRKGTQAVAAQASSDGREMGGDAIALQQKKGTAADAAGNADGGKAGAQARPDGRKMGGDAIALQQKKGPAADATGTVAGVRAEKQTELQTEAHGGPVEKPQGTLLPVRPKHIDQYVYLLPKGTQERAGAVRGLLRELDEAREKMRLLMEDVNAKPDARAAWAKRATQLDEKVGKIYKELDAEWEKLVKSGRVTVDALGNASVGPSSQNDEAQDAPAELTSEQRARRRELRKWLIDLRRGKEGEAREKRIEQWKMNWKEYLTLEPLELALKDEKVVAAATHFGIEIQS